MAGKSAFGCYVGYHVHRRTQHVPMTFDWRRRLRLQSTPSARVLALLVGRRHVYSLMALVEYGILHVYSLMTLVMYGIACVLTDCSLDTIALSLLTLR